MQMVWKHDCTRPKVYDYEFHLLPQEAQDALIEKGLSNSKFKRCSYCGDIWIETNEHPYYDPKGLIQTVVAIEDINHKMIWKFWKSSKQ